MDYPHKKLTAVGSYRTYKIFGTSKDETIVLFQSFSKSEGRLLTLNAFIKYCEDLMKQDLRALWRGIFACGFDLLFERFVSFLFMYDSSYFCFL